MKTIVESEIIRRGIDGGDADLSYPADARDSLLGAKRVWEYRELLDFPLSGVISKCAISSRCLVFCWVGYPTE